MLCVLGGMSMFFLSFCVVGDFVYLTSVCSRSTPECVGSKYVIASQAWHDYTDPNPTQSLHEGLSRKLIDDISNTCSLLCCPFGELQALRQTLSPLALS